MVLVFSSMRVYAISGRSITLSVLVGTLSMVSVVTNMVCLRYDQDSGRVMADWSAVSG